MFERLKRLVGQKSSASVKKSRKWIGVIASAATILGMATLPAPAMADSTIPSFDDHYSQANGVSDFFKYIINNPASTQA